MKRATRTLFFRCNGRIMHSRSAQHCRVLTSTRPSFARLGPGTNSVLSRRFLFSDREIRHRSLSALASEDEEYFETEKHCQTCTCTSQKESSPTLQSPPESLSDDPDDPQHPCGISLETFSSLPLPPALPEPKYSVYKRVLPSHLIALSSAEGRQMLLDSMQQETAESYWSLMEQFTNQSDPAFCGVTTLLVVLNSMGVDPQVRWKGGWRFYGNEDVLLKRCCIPKERIERVGITLDEFALLAHCQGLQVSLHRPSLGKSDKGDAETNTVDDFRRHCKEILSANNKNDILVVSFARSALGQTGEGHFSPIAAYHEETDHVLLLDVARFKYAPYWVAVQDVYQAMLPLDEATQQPRGWFHLVPPKASNAYKGQAQTTEDRRPAHLVPQLGEADICPMGKIKVNYCAASHPTEAAKGSHNKG